MAAAQQELLDNGLRSLTLDTQPDLREQLLHYLALLEKWNRAYNLSAVRDPVEMVPRHLLDSLVVLPHLHGNTLLDIGSGAGLPGIPLALARPDIRCVLLDSNGKKTRFLRQAVLELKLANVEVAEVRVEAFRPQFSFDTVVSRAFADAEEFFSLAQPLAAPLGRLLAMKGRLDRNELTKIDAERGKLDILTLEVPYLDAERHLLQIDLGT